MDAISIPCPQRALKQREGRAGRCGGLEIGEKREEGEGAIS